MATNPPISHHKVVNSKGILPSKFSQLQGFFVAIPRDFLVDVFVSQVLLGRT